MPVDVSAFKDAMSRWTSGVTVVTTAHEGERTGLTISSFTSVSIAPPLVLICIDRRKYARDLIDRAGLFGVSILRADQVALGKRFAGMIPGMEDRFAGVAWITAETGAPLLPDALAWLDCRVQDRHESGDHTIFVGRVVDCQAGEQGDSLVYHNRQWGSFVAAE